MLGDPAGAGVAAGLLVGGAREHDVAAQTGDRVAGRVQTGGAGLRGQPLDDAELQRDHALHVDRAAAPDVAVREVGRERLVGPALGRSRDDVEVREQQQRLAARAVAAEADVDGPATGHGLEDLGHQPGRDQAAGDVPRREQLAVGRGRVHGVDRRDPDERPKRVDERVVGGGPVLGRDLAGRAGRHGRHTPNASAMAMPITNPATMMIATIQMSRRRYLRSSRRPASGLGSVPPTMTGPGRPRIRACLLRSES